MFVWLMTSARCFGCLSPSHIFPIKRAQECGLGGGFCLVYTAVKHARRHRLLPSVCVYVRAANGPSRATDVSHSVNGACDKCLVLSPSGADFENVHFVCLSHPSLSDSTLCHSRKPIRHTSACMNRVGPFGRLLF